LLGQDKNVDTVLKTKFEKKLVSKQNAKISSDLMSIPDKETIAEKIRKLFALAEDNGNENEAALAMLKARALLRQHGFDAAD
jgi:hypothetical protein